MLAGVKWSAKERVDSAALEEDIQARPGQRRSRTGSVGTRTFPEAAPP